jgi:hypothetical protein
MRVKTFIARRENEGIRALTHTCRFPQPWSVRELEQAFIVSEACAAFPEGCAWGGGQLIWGRATARGITTNHHCEMPHTLSSGSRAQNIRPCSISDCFHLFACQLLW